MKYFVFAIVLGFFAALNAAAPTPDDKPDLGQVTIEGVKYAGSGCKAGTASVSYSKDLQTFTILIDKFEPTIGPDTTISNHVKNCNLNFQVNYPPGYQYTLYKYDYTGYFLLEPGDTLKQTSTYWFAGASSRRTFQSTLHGPYKGDYTFTDTLQSNLWVWSPCGTSGALNIDTQAALTSNNPKPPGPIIDPIGIPGIKEYQHVYGLKWSKC